MNPRTTNGTLVADLRRLLRKVVADLTERSDEPDLAWAQQLRDSYRSATEAGRTGLTWSVWRADEIEQAAVAWVLGSVFVRFCEDNRLIDGVWITGEGERSAHAADAETEFYRQQPSRNQRDWLRRGFAQLTDLLATAGVLDRSHSPVWTAPLGAEACRQILDFWREQADDGSLAHSLFSPDLDTRFLGDLYQDLSESAKKKYALLQTPVFIEEFILDQTLEPALAEFGLKGLRLIDPTCGSGHFLLGAFHRLLARWDETAPGMDRRERVQAALDHIHGVDINPFAVAIARFRLTIAALQASGMTRLHDAPGFTYHVAVGDSLLAAEAGRQGEMLDAGGDVTAHHYPEEDVYEYPHILDPGTYHVVVGNPPYITVKDKALNATYRKAYPTCHRKYALSVPFMELFFRLAVRGGADRPAGYVGQITSNSFMKREFGTKVIEKLLAGHDPANPVDLTTVIDTSGAYIPGHGTPTVILIGRRRLPVGGTIRAVLGIRGEPGQPEDPSKGLVWRELVEHVGDPGFGGTYVTVATVSREFFASHPWSLSGGPATSVREALEAASTLRLSSKIERIGFFGIQANDEAYLYDRRTVARLHLEGMRVEAAGETVRDFVAADFSFTFFPYDPRHDLLPLAEFPNTAVTLWPLRTELGNRATFGGGTYFSDERPWYEWHQLPKDEEAHPWCLAIAFVATHNHVVLDRDGIVFHRSAPVIKLPEGATEDDHLALLGVLNSSTACFWLKQVSHNKGNGGIGGGIGDEDWEPRYEFTGTKLQEYPLPEELPLEYGRRLDVLAQRLQAQSPSAVCATGAPTRQRLDHAHRQHDRIRAEMIAVQEELDWDVYRLYGLIDEDLTCADHDLPGLALGERAFEIALARRVAAGEEETAWFERHRSTPVTDTPADWPPAYRDVVRRRLEVIAQDRSIGLLERPEFKRRWASPTWEDVEHDAVTAYCLDSLERSELWRDEHGARIQSVTALAQRVRNDEGLLSGLRVLAGSSDIDVHTELSALLADEGVPFLAAWRYTDSGMVKRAEWEHVWELQRQEDEGTGGPSTGSGTGRADRSSTSSGSDGAGGPSTGSGNDGGSGTGGIGIPVPPKYGQGDFRKTAYWRARGKLDVPKERFISYPGAGAGLDDTELLGWAGWDHAEQAQALARLVLQRANEDGWDRDQLTPMLAGLAELEPWLHQWHSDVDPKYGQSPAAMITGVLEQQLQQHRLTREDLARWRPPAPVRGRRRRS